MEDVMGKPDAAYAPITRATRMSVCEADPSSNSYDRYSESSGLKKNLQQKPMETEPLRNGPSYHDALGLA